MVPQKCSRCVQEGDLVKVEGPPKLLSSNVMGHSDFSCTFIAGNNLMCPVCYFLLAQGPVGNKTFRTSFLHNFKFFHLQISASFLCFASHKGTVKFVVCLPTPQYNLDVNSSIP